MPRAPLLRTPRHAHTPPVPSARARARPWRVAGWLVSAAGVVLLTFTGWVYVSGHLAHERARAAWDAMQARGSVEAVHSIVAMAPARGSRALGSVVGRLWIPTIHLDEIIVEGVDAPQLNVAPGHLPGSALPGETGNAVVSAHRDRHFHRLDKVAVGDTVITEIPGRRTTWVVVARHIVGAHDPAIYGASTPTLTLTTCWPVRYFGPAPDRLILVARPVVSGPSA